MEELHVPLMYNLSLNCMRYKSVRGLSPFGTVRPQPWRSQEM
jgi:hypothetical protein